MGLEGDSFHFLIIHTLFLDILAKANRKESLACQNHGNYESDDVGTTKNHTHCDDSLACSDTDRWERTGDKGQLALRKLTDGKRELFLCARSLH